MKNKNLKNKKKLFHKNLKIFFILLLLPSSAWSLDFPSIEELPAMQELEKATLEYAGLNPTQIQRWQKEARWSAALPRLQVGWTSSIVNQNTNIIEDSISINSAGVTIGPESSRFDQDIENNRDLEVKAVWALDELLFNQNQLYVSREARDLYLVRRKLLEELHQAYYDLKSLLLGLHSKNTQEDRRLWRLKIEEKIDALNSLSGGAFERLLQNKGSSS